MEYTNQEIQEEEEQKATLNFTEEIRSYLYDAARWAKFVAVVGLVIAGLLVILAVSAGSLIAGGLLNNTPYGQLAQFGGSVLSIVFIFYSLLIFVPSFYLYKYATSSIKGILYMDQLEITESFKKLRSFFRFNGILLIVVIVLQLLSVFTILSSGI